MSKVSPLVRQTDSALSSLETSESLKVDSFIIGYKFMDITVFRVVIANLNCFSVQHCKSMSSLILVSDPSSSRHLVHLFLFSL